jgi:type IV secretion system protein VirB1
VILPLAVVTTLALTCAPQVAPATLAAIAQTESGLDPLAVGDNTARRSYHPVAKSQALALAAQLAAEGHDLDFGLMQINYRNFGWLGLAADDAFEPCRSLAAGAAVLTALSRYNTGKSSSPVGMTYARRFYHRGKEEK